MSSRMMKNAVVHGDRMKVFDAFIQIVVFQRCMWETSQVMFHKPASENPLRPQMTRMDVMDILAPNLFGTLRDACVLAVESGISCLLDPKNSNNDSKKQNLVLRHIIDDFGPPPGSVERAAVEADFDSLKRLAKPLRESRNKVGAHLDLNIALAIFDHDQDPAGQTPYPLGTVTVGQLEQMMGLLIRVTDALVAQVRPGHRWYSIDIATEADRLFSAMEKGLRKR